MNPDIQRVKLDSTAVSGLSKTEHYAWAPISGSRPELRFIPKGQLARDMGYQRDGRQLTAHQVKIASEWNWRECGALVVARRHGAWLVVDGQNRVLAALRRQEITDLPCVVIQTTGSAENKRREEAAAFLRINGGRRAVTPLQRFRAGLLARDPLCINAQQVADSVGAVVAGKGNAKGTINFINELCKTVKTYGSELAGNALRICLNMPCDKAVPTKLYRAVVYILNTKTDGRQFDDVFWRMVEEMPVDVAMSSVDALVASCKLSSPRIWANAIIDRVNKNVRNKYSLYDGSRSQ